VTSHGIQLSDIKQGSKAVAVRISAHGSTRKEASLVRGDFTAGATSTTQRGMNQKQPFVKETMATSLEQL